VRASLSRRRFIKGIIASGVASSTATGLPASAYAEKRAKGSVERLISLDVNGRTRRVDVLPQETLAHTLRHKLGLTGTKVSCNRGECGTCTVLIDDVTHYACSLLTHNVKGAAITTVEGLQSADGSLHAVQQAFIDELAPQCGFCTPGQIMAAVGLLKANPRPSLEEARLGMAGNLCRCGAYDHYLRAVMRASGQNVASSSLQVGARTFDPTSAAEVLS
jgi:aerobic-type carbon monoxide dehydrogenase small subunit (CoxS/CutS family)|tara:strand:- start:1160 stop:1816 length:657 start_codon:yes stop_codon:yes gene_type:complete